jgi:dTDP-4-dehydrorhamnose reductase
MKIIGTGLSGLVGTRIIELLNKYEFENLSLETGIDITNKESLDKIISTSKADWVFHLAARTDVDLAEAEKGQGKNSSYWKVNVEATENITEICRNTKKHLLYISTDYVFDGKKDTYSESDTPIPQGWYAMTKYEGEQRVLSLGKLGLVVRIANPYRSRWDGKPDFVHKMMARISQNLNISAANDQTFVPTFIDDIAFALEKLMKLDAHGIYHVVGSQAITPYDSALLVAKTFGFSPENITSTNFATYFKNKAPRPLHANLLNDKISKCGIYMHAFEDGLQIILNQEKGEAKK